MSYELHCYTVTHLLFNICRISDSCLANLFEAAQTRMRVEDVDFILVIIQGLVDERVSAD